MAIEGGTYVLSDALIEGQASDVWIENGLIVRIAPHVALEQTDTIPVLDGHHQTLFPSFVNMHTHAPMTLLRGLGDDQPLDRWLNDYIWPAEKRLTPADIRLGTQQACHEMWTTGTVAFNDMYFQLPSMAAAVEETAMYAQLGLNIFGDADELLDDATFEQLQHPTSHVRYSIAPHSIYTVSEVGLRRCAEACVRLQLPMHIHMSETQKEVADCIAQHGCRPWEWLAKIGVLDAMGSQLIAAHCLHLSDNEIRLIGDHHVNVVHCPNSNLKLGSGCQFKMLELQQAGANVCLGTDGSASSNNLDMLETVKTATLLQKGWRENATAISARQVYEMATLNGAKALGLNSGKIAVGYRADFFLAPYTTVEDLVYASYRQVVEPISTCSVDRP